MNIIKHFNKPQILGIVAEQNTGKSNLIYYLIDSLKKEGSFHLVTFGLRKSISNSTVIFSVEELERVKNSIIIVDEFFTLFDLDNRKQKRTIEDTIRLIHHNNNILLLCGLPENFKKFICAKVDKIFFKSAKIEDFINGSGFKNRILSYSGAERGSTRLSLAIDETLFFDGEHWDKLHVPYMRSYDTKATNTPIIKLKKQA